MSDFDELMARIPVGQIAAQLGVDRDTADTAIRQALPALVAGMNANSREPSGAASLVGALEQHDPDLLDGAGDLDTVNVQDGEKIVAHVFGSKRGQVVDALGGLGGKSTGIPAALMAKLLPLLAPIVMSYLAKRLGSATASGTTKGGSSGADVLIDILKSILRQGPSPSGQTTGGAGGSAGGFDLGSILGDLLGAGRR